MLAALEISAILIMLYALNYFCVHRIEEPFKDLERRLDSITRIEYESEADRNTVSVEYYVTNWHLLAVVLTIRPTDPPIVLPGHDSQLSTVFINDARQRASSDRLKRQALNYRPFTAYNMVRSHWYSPPKVEESPDRIIRSDGSITVVNLYRLEADYGVFDYSDAQHQPRKAQDISSIRIRINTLHHTAAGFIQTEELDHVQER